MSVVDRIELFIAETPLPASWKPAWVPGQTRNTQRNFLIRITTDDGVEGWSAMVAWGRDRVGIGNMIAFLFLGRDPTDIELVHDQLHIVSMFGHREGWIEPAFWDIKGKLAGKPVCTLLGGGPCTLELYASAGELKSPAERIEEAEARLAEGFRVLKVRVHDFDEARDIEQVVEPARAMAGRMQLAVDCNQAFRFDFLAKSPRWDLARAKRFVDAVEDCGLAWIEEPQFMERFDDMAEIARYARTPIAGGELHWAGYPELAHMVKQGCYDIFQPDALWVGGIKTCHELAQLCAAHGRSFTPHTWNHGIGFAANMQVLAGTNFAGKVLLEYPIAPPGWTPEGRDFLLTEPFLHDRGRITVPDRPGLGFEIDRAALDQYAVKYFEATRKSLVWMPEKLMPWG